MKAEVRAGSQAEADLMTEVRAGSQAEVNRKTDPMIDDPRKGWNLLDARRRRRLQQLGSVLGTKREWAEPLSRRNGSPREKTSTTLLGMVRWKDLLEVFGRRSKLV